MKLKDPEVRKGEGKHHPQLEQEFYWKDLEVHQLILYPSMNYTIYEGLRIHRPKSWAEVPRCFAV